MPHSSLLRSPRRGDRRQPPVSADPENGRCSCRDSQSPSLPRSLPADVPRTARARRGSPEAVCEPPWSGPNGAPGYKSYNIHTYIGSPCSTAAARERLARLQWSRTWILVLDSRPGLGTGIGLASTDWYRTSDVGQKRPRGGRGQTP